MGIVSTKLGKEILGLGDARNEMICFVLRHRAGVSDNEPQEICRGGGRNLPGTGEEALQRICTANAVIKIGRDPSGLVLLLLPDS